MKHAAGLALLAMGLFLVVVPVRAQSHTDKDFLKTASQGDIVEVELAKLALKKSSNPEIQAFAKRMIHDHEILERQMKPFVVQAGIQPPTSLNTEHQHLYNKLNGLSGEAFDKAYVDDMDKDHHQDLADFQKEIASTKDAQLKATVEQGEKVIVEHVQMIDGIDRKMGMTPAST